MFALPETSSSVWRRLSRTERAQAIAFRAVFDANFDYVWSTVRYLGVRGEDTQDVCQEVFASVYRHLDSYDPSKPIRPWLFAFAYHAASNFRRLAHHRREVSEEDGTVGSSYEPEGRLEARSELELVTKALDTIDLDKKVVLILHDIEGQGASEIAELLKIPLNTVYSRLRRGRELFQDAVQALQMDKQEAKS